MEIGVVSIFPDMFRAISEFGMTRQALETGAVSLEMFNPRDFTTDRHRAVDDRPYGGGPGMVMKPEPLSMSIDSAKQNIDGPVIYLSPQGDKLDQSMVRRLSTLSGMILVCGRYEGIDERIVESRIDQEISIGDYVLAGGELPAMVVVDAIARLLPGVLGNDLSAQEDSFSANLLDCPHFTRPEVFEGIAVPDVLLSGDHEKIRRWRLEQARARTLIRRPDLLNKQGKDNE
jgi:tRNA (guanine37-N1)-methyltransferase